MCRWPAARSLPRRRQSPGCSTKCECQFEHDMRVQRIGRRRGSPSPTATSSCRTSSPRSPGRCRAGLRRCAPDHGRRADLRCPRLPGRCRMEHCRHGAEQAPPGRRAVPPPARALCAAGPGAFRSGASGTRASCRAGRSTASGARTASRSGRTRRCMPTKPATTAPTSRLAARFLASLAGRLGLSAKHVFPAYEDSLYYLARTPACRPMSPRRMRAWLTHSERRTPPQGVPPRSRRGGRAGPAADAQRRR